MWIKSFSKFQLIFNLLSISIDMSLLWMKPFDEKKGLAVLQNLLLPMIPFFVAFLK